MNIDQRLRYVHDLIVSVCDYAENIDPAFYEQSEDVTYYASQIIKLGDEIKSAIEEIRYNIGFVDTDFWTLVENKKPRAGVWVLVLCDNGFCAFCRRARNRDDYWIRKGQKAENVIAWHKIEIDK